MRVGGHATPGITRDWSVDTIPVHGTWSATRCSLRGQDASRLKAALPRSRPVAFSGNTVLLEMADDDGVTTFELRRLVARAAGRITLLPGATGRGRALAFGVTVSTRGWAGRVGSAGLA